MKENRTSAAHDIVHGCYPELHLNDQIPNYEKEVEIAKKAIQWADEHPTENFVPAPPLGPVPQFVVLERRKTELIEAMNRFIAANLEIRIEWVQEYNEIVYKLNRIKP